MSGNPAGIGKFKHFRLYRVQHRGIACKPVFTVQHQNPLPPGNQGQGQGGSDETGPSDDDVMPAHANALRNTRTGSQAKRTTGLV